MVEMVSDTFNRVTICAQGILGAVGTNMGVTSVYREKPPLPGISEVSTTANHADGKGTVSVEAAIGLNGLNPENPHVQVTISSTNADDELTGKARSDRWNISGNSATSDGGGSLHAAATALAEDTEFKLNSEMFLESVNEIAGAIASCAVSENAPFAGTPEPPPARPAPVPKRGMGL